VVKRPKNAISGAIFSRYSSNRYSLYFFKWSSSSSPF